MQSKYIYFIFVTACEYVYMCAHVWWSMQRSEEGIDFPGAEVTGSC